jgi:hypothetical protein
MFNKINSKNNFISKDINKLISFLYNNYSLEKINQYHFN